MPSIATRTFREPWGLVANEAMHAGLPVIATDAVGAAAGGLVRHERNGLVVPAGDASALAGAIERLRNRPGGESADGHEARARTPPPTRTRPGRRESAAPWPPPALPDADPARRPTTRG